jgi:hypothetical protein
MEWVYVASRHSLPQDETEETVYKMRKLVKQRSIPDSNVIERIYRCQSDAAAGNCIHCQRPIAGSEEYIELIAYNIGADGFADSKLNLRYCANCGSKHEIAG